MKFSDCIDYLSKSTLDLYTCWHIIKSMLSQHPDFSPVFETSETRYSITDLNTAISRLQSFSIDYETEQRQRSTAIQLSRLDLLLFCALEAATCRVGLRTSALPRKGFLDLFESVLQRSNNTLKMKGLTSILQLQYVADMFLIADTSGQLWFSEEEIDSVLGLRSRTFHLVMKTSTSVPRDTSSDPACSIENTKAIVWKLLKFSQRPWGYHEFSGRGDDIQLTLVRINNWISRRNQQISELVLEYFRDRNLQLLLCPISNRPMTDAVYLRCGKTVGRSAFLGLLSGEFPAAHCCCDGLYDDLQHDLHPSPVISQLSITHLSLFLEPKDIVKYGDLPTIEFVFPTINSDHTKLELLQTAIVSENDPIAKFLASRIPDLNRFVDGRTALICAASIGSEFIVSMLLEQGASTELRDNAGRNALNHAAANYHSGLMRILFQSSTSVSLQEAMDAKQDVPSGSQLRCSMALHDIWQGLQLTDDRNSVRYLQRAMELDPENHLFAEEMQECLDLKDSPQQEGNDLRSFGNSFLNPFDMRSRRKLV